MATEANTTAAHYLAAGILYAQAYGGEMPKHPLVPDDAILELAEEWANIPGADHPDYDAECLKLIESYTPIKDR